MTQKELEELDKIARLRRWEADTKKELNDADNQLIVEQNRNNVRLDREQLQRQAEHERSMAARKRFADSHAFTAVTQPGRYAPQVVQAARAYLEGQGFGQEGERRRQFDEQQKTARHEADMKAQGMERQGQGAAEARANADMKIAETNAASAQKIKDAELAASKELAATEAETKKYGIDAEYGKYNKDGTVTEGSRERTERIRGEASVESARETAKGMIGKAEAQRLQKQQEWEARAKAQMGRNASAYTNAQIRGMSSIISKAYESALTPADREKVTNQLKEQYKDNPLALSLIGTMDAPKAQPANQQGQTPQAPQKPQGGNAGPKEGERRQTKEGWAVYRGGKWVLE